MEVGLIRPPFFNLRICSFCSFQCCRDRLDSPLAVTGSFAAFQYRPVKPGFVGVQRSWGRRTIVNTWALLGYFVQ
jgi:hypothetical protein